jgi:mannose-6-phosphate isomerase-like protein (cupin superfamily)
VARPGDVLENPATGERIIFRRTAADTGGELLRYEAVFTPRGLAAREHVHPYQEERHEILAGSPTMSVEGRRRQLGRGDVVVVPAGTRHRLWSDGEVHVLFEFRPALRWESIFAFLVGLAREGKLNRWGYPNLFQLAVFAREYRNEISAARPPLPVQQILLPVLAAIGRRLGYSVPAG